jgi:hypothetical protein
LNQSLEKNQFKKIFKAATGPLKTIAIVWIFLLMLFSFVYFLLFDPKGLLYPLQEKNIAFGIISILFSGLLFLYWLIVWNILIKAFFKEDLSYCMKNGIKLEDIYEK